MLFLLNFAKASDHFLSGSRKGQERKGKQESSDLVDTVVVIKFHGSLDGRCLKFTLFLRTVPAPHLIFIIETLSPAIL